MLDLEFERAHPEFLENILKDQKNCSKYLSRRCLNCLNHSVEWIGNKMFHICDDDWSGLDVGKHLFYSETRDICIEVGGFKSK
jgi:hypothetical protein